MTDFFEKKYEFFHILHPSHLMYIHRGCFNSLRYLFRTLDALDAEKRNRILDPLYSMTFAGKKFNHEMQDKEALYGEFKQVYVEYINMNTEIIVVDGLIQYLLSYLFSMGDKTSVEEGKDRIIGAVEVMQEEMGIPASRDPHSIVNQAVNLAENLPEQTDSYYDLYTYFCENVLERLFAENPRV